MSVPSRSRKTPRFTSSRLRGLLRHASDRAAGHRVRHGVDGDPLHAPVIDRTVAQHAGPAEDRVRQTSTSRSPRRRSGAVARSSVGPKIATTGTPSAAARCIAPESFDTNAAQRDRRPRAAAGRCARSGSRRATPGGSDDSISRPASRSPAAPTSTRDAALARQPRDRPRATRPAASASRGRRRRPGAKPTERLAAPVRRRAPPAARRARARVAGRHDARRRIAARRMPRPRTRSQVVPTGARAAAAARTARVSSNAAPAAPSSPSARECRRAVPSSADRNEFGSSRIASNPPASRARRASRAAIARADHAVRSGAASPRRRAARWPGSRRRRCAPPRNAAPHRRHRRQRHHGVAEPVRARGRPGDFGRSATPHSSLVAAGNMPRDRRPSLRRRASGGASTARAPG